MNGPTRLKLAFALGGLVLFGIGVRLGNERLRWAAIACVAVAFLLRFWKSPPPDAENQD